MTALVAGERRSYDTLMRPAALALAALAACSGANKQREPMGILPTAVTTAEPLWIPFRVRAGKAVDADPRETHFAELRRLTTDGSAGAPVWDPGGAKLLHLPSATCRSIAIVDLAAGTADELPMKGPLNSLAPAQGLAFSQCSGAAADITPCWPAAGLVGQTATMPLDLFACELARADDGQLEALPGVYGLAATGDGKHVAFASKRDGDVEIYLAGSNGAGVERITRFPGPDTAPRISADASSIVWQARHGKEEEQQVWIAGLHGARPRQLTRDGRNNAQPAFCPDSRQVIYASDRDSADKPPHLSLYRIDPDAPAGPGGAPRVERITYADGIDAAPAFSPDGHWLAFVSSRGGAMDLYVARWKE